MFDTGNQCYYAGDSAGHHNDRLSHGDYHPVRERRSPGRVPAYSHAPSAGLDSLEDMLNVASSRHRPSHRASPQRVAASSYRDPSLHHYRGASPSTGVPQGDLSSGAPWLRAVPSRPVSVAAAAPSANAGSLATDLYVVQLEQEVEALTSDCARVTGLLARTSATCELSVVRHEELTARRALEQAEQHSYASLAALFHSTLTLRKEAYWTEKVRAAEWQRAATEERASALAASKTDLERHVERLERQLESALSSSTLAASVEALLRTENEKITSLLDKVPARVCTEMSASVPTPATASSPQPATPLPTAAPAVGDDSALRALIESIAKQLQQRGVGVSSATEEGRHSHATPTVSAAAAPIPPPSSTSASSSAEYTQLTRSVVDAVQRMTDAYLRACDDKMREVEYEMKVVLLVAHKQEALTWASRHEDLHTENRRLQEAILSLRTQLKLALNRDSTPSASLIFNTYGAAGEKRARVYAQYASPFIPPSLELTAAPEKRSADDLRRDAIQVGARPVEAPVTATPTRTDPEDAPLGQWQFTSNMRAKPVEAAGATGIGASSSSSLPPLAKTTRAVSATFSLPSQHTDSPRSADDHSDKPDTPKPAPRGSSTVAPAKAASPSPNQHVNLSHDEASTTVLTTVNGSLSGVPQVKRFAPKVFRHSSSSSASSTSTDSSDDSSSDSPAKSKAKPTPAVRQVAVRAPSSSSSSSAFSSRSPSPKKVAAAKGRSAAESTSANAKRSSAAAPSAPQQASVKRKNSFDGSTTASSGSDSGDDDDDGSGAGAAPRATTASGAPVATAASAKPAAGGLKSVMARLSAASSLNTSFSNIKPQKAGSQDKSAPVKTANVAPKVATKAPPAAKRNTFDDESSDDDVKATDSGVYTYSYSSTSSAPAQKPKAATTAAAARRSSFDDDDDDDKAASRRKPKAATVASTPSAKKSVSASSPTVTAGTKPAATTAASSQAAQTAGAAAKPGGLKLPSW